MVITLKLQVYRGNVKLLDLSAPASTSIVWVAPMGGELIDIVGGQLRSYSRITLMAESSQQMYNPAVEDISKLQKPWTFASMLLKLFKKEPK